MGLRSSFVEAVSRVLRVHESVPAPSTDRLAEDVGVGLGYGAFGLGIDPDEHLYRRITQSQRELPPIIQDRMLRLSWSLYESNPLAHGIIETMKDYIVGKGFTVRSANPDVQKIIDKHWFDHLNRWDVKQHDRVRDLNLFGELILLVSVNKADGHVRVASLDPINVRNIYTNIDNPEDVETLVFNPRRRVGGLSNSDKFYRVIHKDEEPASPTYGKLIGAKEGEAFTPINSRKTYPYSGSVFYFTINKVTGAIRGRSDLLSVIDWLDSYDQILFNFVDRTLLMNCFVWDVTLTNATRSQVLQWRADHTRAPKPGTVNVHNENEVWKEVSPKFQRAEFEVQEKTLKAQILSAVGLPLHWFGEQIAGRTNAPEVTIPAIKRLSARQLLIKYMFEFVYEFVLDQAVIAQQLVEAPEDKPYRVEVVVPEMSDKDLSQAATSMMNVVQAITIALTAGLLDLLAARRIFVTIAEELGADINLDEMLLRIGDDGAGVFGLPGMEPVTDLQDPGGLKDDFGPLGGGGHQVQPGAIGADGKPVSSPQNTKNQTNGPGNPVADNIKPSPKSANTRVREEMVTRPARMFPVTLRESLALLRAYGADVDGQIGVEPSQPGALGVHSTVGGPSVASEDDEESGDDPNE